MRGFIAARGVTRLAMPLNMASLLVGDAHASLALAAFSGIPATLVSPGQNTCT